MTFWANLEQIKQHISLTLSYLHMEPPFCFCCSAMLCTGLAFTAPLWAAPAQEAGIHWPTPNILWGSPVLKNKLAEEEASAGWGLALWPCVPHPTPTPTLSAQLSWYGAGVSLQAPATTLVSTVCLARNASRSPREDGPSFHLNPLSPCDREERFGDVGTQVFGSGLRDWPMTGRTSNQPISWFMKLVVLCCGCRESLFLDADHIILQPNMVMVFKKWSSKQLWCIISGFPNSYGV